LSRLKLYYIVVEYTSIPLLLCFYLSYLSGKGLVKIELVKTLTFGIISYPASVFLHTSSALNFIFAILVIFHSVSGLCLLVNRRIKDWRIKTLVETAIVAVIGLYSLLIFILLELY
jgi:hypothetical protein